jgi:DNA-binding transcriptional LysR family regulator
MNPGVRFDGGQFDTLIGMVRARFGVTPLPQGARVHDQDARVRFLESKPPKPLRVGRVRLRDNLLRPSARAFVEVLDRSFASPTVL